jgi:hypothetical protein
MHGMAQLHTMLAADRHAQLVDAARRQAGHGPGPRRVRRSPKARAARRRPALRHVAR